MKLTICRHCGGMLHFEQSTCGGCGAPLGFIPGDLYLSVIADAGNGTVEPVSRPGLSLRPCANAAAAGCNWLIPAASDDTFCFACRFNRTIPDLRAAKRGPLWRKVECAKRRLVYAILRFGLPVTCYRDVEEGGLAFDFLADTRTRKIMTGHAGGVITINIAEADPVERERRRVSLGEPLRTMLGHMRHEIAHYYWDVLVRDNPGRLAACRAIFGDDSEDYGEALKRYYRDGPPQDWWERHVSEYAAAHPWEDFAETWTHYLHMIDTLDTAASFGVAVNPGIQDGLSFAVRVPEDPYRGAAIEDLTGAWRPMTVAVNGLNRSMGQPDLYPFVLSRTATDKLAIIHLLVQESRVPDATPPDPTPSARAAAAG